MIPKHGPTAHGLTGERAHDLIPSMLTHSFGYTGVAVPIIGQGTWRMGEAARRRDDEVAALQLGLELGLTHLDTAEMYGGGGAEELIARALHGRRRDEVFLVSKVLPQNASYDGTLRAADASLRRLGVDHLDVYLLHWRGRHPLVETMAAMEELVKRGRTRFIGVSNFDVDDLREAMSALGRERLACNQVLYNLGTRGIERELVPFCRRNGIAVVGYTPFGSLRSRGEGARVLRQVADRHGATPRQVALRFLTRLPGTFAIPKASRPDHVRENAAAADLALTDDDVEAVDRAFPAPRRRGPLRML